MKNWTRGFIFCVAVVLLTSVFPFNRSSSIVLAATSSRLPSNQVQVYGIRKFPYPYQAMLAVSSDADHQTLRKFNLVHEFLNTNVQTPMGQGLGLDISDSFFMYNGSDLAADADYAKLPLSKEMTYFKGVSSQLNAGNLIDFYIAAGWMDSIHTFGDFNMSRVGATRFHRELAKQAITALRSSGDKISVWIDHGNASNVDNFGSYGIRPFYNYQKGASPQSLYYHTDLTLPYGIQFVWADESSNVFGRDTMLYPLHLPDGRHVWGFWRYTDKGRTAKGIEWLWSSDALSREITVQNLSSMITHHQYAVVAQHLCGANSLMPLGSDAIHALRMLANEYRHGKILVTRTSRLLRYNATNEYIRYRVEHAADGGAVIHIIHVDDPVLGRHLPTIQELRGITFYTSNPACTTIEIGNQPIAKEMIEYHSSDGKSPSISVKWFSADTSNYADLSSRLFSQN